MCCYFDDIIKIEDFDFDNVLLYDKSYKNILIYDVFYKTLIGKKPLSIIFNKVDGFIRYYDATKWLVLFGFEKFNATYDRFRYIIQLKNGITYVFSYNYAKIKIDTDDDLDKTLEKTLNLRNFVIHIKLALNKTKNHHYYNIFLE